MLNPAPCPVPIEIVAPLAVQLMFVSVHPASADSCTYLSPSCVPSKASGPCEPDPGGPPEVTIVPKLVNPVGPEPVVVYVNVEFPPTVPLSISRLAFLVLVNV